MSGGNTTANTNCLLVFHREQSTQRWGGGLMNKCDDADDLLHYNIGIISEKRRDCLWVCRFFKRLR